MSLREAFMQGNYVCITKVNIYDEDGKVFAHEMLTNKGEEINFKDDTSCSTPIIIKFCELFGIDILAQNTKIIVKMGTQFKDFSVVLKLPSANVLLAITEKDIINDHRVLLICKNLKKKGYSIIVGEYALKPGYSKILKIADYVWIDIQANSSNIRLIKSKISRLSLKCIAVRISTQAQCIEAINAGCTYFQGVLFENERALSLLEKQKIKNGN